MEKIKIDRREHLFITEGFKLAGIEHEIVTLPLGDFSANNVIIEHKTALDFVSSMKNNHLYDQLLRMSEQYSASYLIISKSWSDVIESPYHSISPMQLIGMITSIYAKFPTVKIIQTHNLARSLGIPENVLLAHTIYQICAKNGESITKYDVFTKESNIDDIELRMFMQVPGVGAKTGREILKKITLKAIYTSSVEDLTKLGIGLKTAEKIKKYIK